MNNKQNGVSRLLRLVWKEYKIEMLVVILAIIGSALASVKGTLFLQTLIDDYIVPLTESNYPDFAPLASALFKIAMIYILGMDKLMAGRTTFVIAHRLSTIRNADCIMVLENGKIIERGNHEQLIKEKGRYYQLYTGDFELSY